MTYLRIILLCSAIRIASATVHNLFVPNLRDSPVIHALEFNDEANTLVKVQSFKAGSTHAWIQFDVRSVRFPSRVPEINSARSMLKEIFMARR
jgi:hypothetical protein